MGSPLRGARKLSLTTNDALSLYLKASGGKRIPSKLTMLLPANRPAHVDFAVLLSTHTSVHAISPDAHTHALAESHGLRSTLAPGHIAASSSLLTRFAAWTAIRASHSAVVLPETAHDDALISLSTRTGALPSCSSVAPGAEMLPPGALSFVRPLLPLTPDDLHERATALGAPLSAAREHGARRADALKALTAASDVLLRDCVLEASHWGFLVLRRSVLAPHYAADAASRLVALDALARAMAHVSGSAEPLPATAEHVSRVAEVVLAVDVHGVLRPLPKGRTAAGMVMRRATGRFARRIAQADAQTRGRPEDQHGVGRAETPDDLMILTREPDHESTGLLAKRLGGNAACAPLTEPTYWDNRYVMRAAPVAELQDGAPAALSDAAVLEAVLRPPSGGDAGAALRECEVYARQLRRADWERITAATERVRNFQVPFECIRALPGIFEKQKGGTDVGTLVASPHLGLTSRNDLFFTAVRVPRFRTLPDDMCPGFVLENVREQRTTATNRWRGRTGVRPDGAGRPRGRGGSRLGRGSRLSDAFLS